MVDIHTAYVQVFVHDHTYIHTYIRIMYVHAVCLYVCTMGVCRSVVYA